MKKTIRNKLVGGLVLAVLLSIGVFTILIRYNKETNSESMEELGTIYVSEMMYQLQEHLRSIVDMKAKEAAHIVKRAQDEAGEPYKVLRFAAESMDFEYVALYDDAGNIETVLGEAAWYRDMNRFTSSVLAGEQAVTTGYLTSTGGKYLVFGVPAVYEMSSGQESRMVLLGFNVENLYEYINLEGLEQFGSSVYLYIVSTNGSFVLKGEEVAESSFYDRINNMGTFEGMSQKEGMDYIEASMAGREDFGFMIDVNGEMRHAYGAPAGMPEDWYFLISMPGEITDSVLLSHNSNTVKAFMIAGATILSLFFIVFIYYFVLLTEQMKIIEEARQKAVKAEQEAEHANKAKSTFLSNMSHDIRTPMNAVVGFTNLAMKETDFDKVQEYLSKISSSSRHLLMLINDVLEMSRIESGRVILNELPHSITDILGELQNITSKKVEEKHQTLTMETELETDDVYCDRLRINQILTNLVGNAVKYTQEGGTIAVLVKQKPCEKENACRYEISVTDNGVGIETEFLDKVFEPFEREHNSTISGIEGTGLGLSIVKHLVEIMGGEITVASEKNIGTTFKVTLDLRSAEEEGVFASDNWETKAEEVLDKEEMYQFFKGKRILLAEDNDFNREIAHGILESCGFAVEDAENGKIAGEKVLEANAGYYDVILMDVQMPVMNGYEATKAIRGFSGGREKVKIIALTANAFESDRQNALRAGMDDYISKPIEVENLYKVLKKNMK